MPKKRSHGEGSLIERPGGKWQAQLRLPDGSRRSRTFATKREATAWLAETRTKAAQGMLAADDRTTLGEYLETWYTGHAPTLRPKTQARMRDNLDRHIIPHLGRLVLARLRPDHLSAYYAGRQQAGAGAATIKLCHELLTQALQRATEWGLIPRNPATLVRPPRYRARAMHPLTPQQAATLLADARGCRFEPFYHLALMGGLRCGECLAVRWSDIDWQAGTVQVARQVVYIPKQGVTFSEVKTTSGRRRVPLPAPTLAVLKEYRKRQLAGRLALQAVWQDHDLVLCTSIGKPLAPQDIWRDWGQRRRRLGLPTVRIHDLRHTYATMLLSAGVHPRVAQERLGHSSVRLTLDTYSHVMPAMHAEATERLTALVFGAECQQIASNTA